MMNGIYIPVIGRIADKYERSEFNPDGGGYETVLIEPDDELIDRLIEMVHKPLRDRASKPELLIVGWRTYYTIALWWTNLQKSDDFQVLDHFYTAKLLMDPSRENYARVIEDKRYMKRCPPIEWNPDDGAEREEE